MANEQFATGTGNYRNILTPNIQLFGESGDNGATNDAGNDPANTATGDNATKEAPKQETTLLTDEMKKHIQSEIDRGLAEERKKNATLQKENEKLKKEKMSADELKKYEDEQKDKQLTERENALTERENRLFAIEALKEIGLDDGSKQSLDLVDLVMAGEQDAITERVKALKAVVDRLVTAEVDKTIAANGRVPHGANIGNGGETKDNNIAVELGKQTAKSNAQSNEVLKHYYGG